ncbi:MAG TPA: DNA alkylation repair protein [Anaerolineae bacterium]|nr:DNA alkylation repair protein [Anaerolineae bacterium]
MDTVAEQRKLLREIEARADPHYEQVVQKSVPSSLRVYGLRVWEIRQIIRAWRREHRDVSLGDLLPLVQQLWKGESREERMVALELLQHYPHVIPLLTWEQLARWRQDIDNWELTDVLGREVLGPWVAAEPDGRERHLWDLLREQDVWSRRLGLVGRIGQNRAHPRADSSTLTLAMVDEVKHERDARITKAVSWALRDLTKSHPALVSVYLDGNEGVLARHVTREVRNKLETGRKDGKRKG